MAHSTRIWATGAVAGISLFSMVAAFGTAPSTSEIADYQRQVIQQLPLRTVTPVDERSDPFVSEERIRRGDTVAELLPKLGVKDSAALPFLRKNSTTATMFRQMSPGKPVTASVNADGSLMSMTFPLNGNKDQALIIERHHDTFKVSEQTLPTETQVLFKSAEIRHSLFGATDAAGIPDSVAIQLADIFGSDIDFHTDLRKGDRFSVVYESITHLGKQIRTGRILAAEFVNKGHSYSAIWFKPDANSNGGYYTVEGKSLRQAFLRSPLEFTRISSGFTMSRFHPILKEVRAHKGIDFAAPTGTGVKATGDGVVEFVGQQRGYGNLIILSHQDKYNTVYGHLSGFASGLKKGAKVEQGSVIGYVGATGWATGPHLHYEFRVDGVHCDPLTVALPGTLPLEPQQMAQFKEQSADILAQLELLRKTRLALLE